MIMTDVRCVRGLREVAMSKQVMYLGLSWRQSTSNGEDYGTWEIAVYHHDNRVGVTQITHLDDLGQTVHDYVSLAGGTPIEPGSMIEKSLLPKALPASVEDTAYEIVHNFICSCPDVGGMPPYPCPSSRQVSGIVERLDEADLLVRESTVDGE